MASFIVQKYSRHLERFGSSCIIRLRKCGIYYPRSAIFLSLQLRSISSTCIQFSQMPAKSNDPDSQKDTSSANSDPSTTVPSLTSSHDLKFHLPSPPLISNDAPNGLPPDSNFSKSAISTQHSSHSSIDINSIISKYAPPASKANNFSPSFNLNASESEESEEPDLVEFHKSPSEGDIGKELAGALNTSNLL